MAKTVVALEATINSSNAEGSVKSLRAQLKEAQADVQNLSDKFGATSQEAVNAAKKAAELKDRIGDAKALTDAFNPDAKFKAFGAALQGVAGGFAAAQGAIGLFGAESENLQKTLLKVQSAMALSQGLNALGEAGDAFKTLGKQAIDAFNKIKVAIGTSGIGLLVVALGAIYAYWDDIKGAVSGVSAEQQKLNEKTKANLDAEKEKLKHIGDQDNILKLQGKSEREILKLKIGQIDAVIKATEASIVQSKITKDAQVEAAKRNQQILKGILEFVAAPITMTLRGIDSIGKALGKNFGLEEKFFGGISKFVFDPVKVAEDGDKTIKEQQDALAQLKNDRAGFQLQINAIDKTASDNAKTNKEKADKEKETADKEAEQKEKARLENIAAQNKATDELILRNRIQSIKDEFDKKQFELAVQQQKEIDAQIDLLNQGLITQEEYNQRKELIDANYKQQEKDNLDAHNKDIIQKNKDAAEAQKKIDEEVANNKIQQAQRGVALLSNISELIGKQTAAGKATAIAAATIDTYQAAWSAFKNAQKNPISILGPVYPYLQAGLAVAGGIANIKKIMAVQVPGGSGGGGSVPSGGMNVPSAPVAPQVATTTINQGQVNQLASATARAFVLESDVSGNQERIQRLNRAARIN